jgi:hypothetical protein
MPDELVNVPDLVDDVEDAVDLYTTSSASPALGIALAFADVLRGNLCLLPSGPKSSAGGPMPDGQQIPLEAPSGPIELFQPAGT